MIKNTPLYIALSLFYTAPFYGSMLKDLAQSKALFAQEVHSEKITALLGKMDHYADVLNQSRQEGELIVSFFERINNYAKDKTNTNGYIGEVCRDVIKTNKEFAEEILKEKNQITKSHTIQ